MPRYRVVFFTDTDDDAPSGRDFTADAFIIDKDTEAILLLEHLEDDTSIVVGAVAPGMWQTIDKVADTRPALEVKATFDGISQTLTPPAMVNLNPLVIDPDTTDHSEGNQ